MAVPTPWDAILESGRCRQVAAHQAINSTVVSSMQQPRTGWFLTTSLECSLVFSPFFHRAAVAIALPVVRSVRCDCWLPAGARRHGVHGNETSMRGFSAGRPIAGPAERGSHTVHAAAMSHAVIRRRIAALWKKLSELLYRARACRAHQMNGRMLRRGDCIVLLQFFRPPRNVSPRICVDCRRNDDAYKNTTTTKNRLLQFDRTRWRLVFASRWQEGVLRVTTTSDWMTAHVDRAQLLKANGVIDPLRMVSNCQRISSRAGLCFRSRVKSAAIICTLVYCKWVHWNNYMHASCVRLAFKTGYFFRKPGKKINIEAA